MIRFRGEGGFLDMGLAMIVGALATSGFVALVAATGSPEIAPWAQVGGTATAVGALAYVAKRFADGSLVANRVAEREKKLVELVEAGLGRERKLDEHLQDARADREALRSLLVGLTKGPS